MSMTRIQKIICVHTYHTRTRVCAHAYHTHTNTHIYTPSHPVTAGTIRKKYTHSVNILITSIDDNLKSKITDLSA